MTLRQLQYAITVYRCGSLTSAAKALFISQSALSFAVRELEQETGITIFERSRQGMRPTEEGKVFLKRADKALQAIKDLLDSARSTDSVIRFRVATVQSGVLPAALARLVDELSIDDASYRMCCVMRENSQVIDMVANDECDMGFVYATERQAKLWRASFAQRGIEIIQIHTFSNLAIISADDPLAQRDELRIDELSGHTFIFSGEDGLDNYSYLEDYSVINFPFHEHARYVDVQDSLLLNHLLHSTKSFSLGHRSFMNRYTDNLAYIPLRDCQRVHLWLLRPKGKPMNAIETRFVKLMREESVKL